MSAELGKLNDAGVGEHMHIVCDEDEWLAMGRFVWFPKRSLESWLISEKVHWARMWLNTFAHQYIPRASRITQSESEYTTGCTLSKFTVPRGILVHSARHRGAMTHTRSAEGQDKQLRNTSLSQRWRLCASFHVAQVQTHAVQSVSPE